MANAPSYAGDGKLRLETKLGVRYELLNGFPTYDYSAEGANAIARYRIESKQLKFFIGELFPPPRFQGNFLVEDEALPLAGSSMMFPVSASVVPFHDSLPFDPYYSDHGTIGHSTQASPLSAAEWEKTYSQFAIVTVEYENRMPYDGGDPDTFLEHSISVGGEFLALSEQNTKWRQSEQLDQVWQPIDGTEGFEFPSPPDPSGKPFLHLLEGNIDFKVPATKVIPTIEHQMRWRNVVEPPWERIRQAIGRVNSERITWLSNANPETVMFLGVTGTRRFRSTTYAHDKQVNPLTKSGVDQFTTQYGDFALFPWTLDFKFTERRLWRPGEVQNEDPEKPGSDPRDITVDWNYVYRPSTGRFEILHRADGTKLYEASDFNGIFRRDIGSEGEPLKSYAFEFPSGNDPSNYNGITIQPGHPSPI